MRVCLFALLIDSYSNSQISKKLINHRGIESHAFLSAVRPDGLFYFGSLNQHPELPILVIENGTQRSEEQHKDLDVILYTMRNLLKFASHKLNMATNMYGILTSGPYVTFISMNSKIFNSIDDSSVLYYEASFSEQLHMKKNFAVVLYQLRAIATQVMPLFIAK